MAGKSKRSPHSCFNRKANRRCVLNTLKPAQKSRSPLRVLGKVTTRRKLLPNALKLSCEAKGTTTFSLVEKWKYRLLKNIDNMNTTGDSKCALLLILEVVGGTYTLTLVEHPVM